MFHGGFLGFPCRCSKMSGYSQDPPLPLGALMEFSVSPSGVFLALYHLVFFLVKGLFRAMGAHRRWWPLSSWLQPQLMGSSGGMSRALASTECHLGTPSPEGEHHCCHMSLSCKGPWRIWHF